MYVNCTITISIDQEKAFDRVGHSFLFSTLQAFGVGEHFLSLLKLLYSDACCVVKVGGGLSSPVSVKRGIRQGCPISDQLYSGAIEPLLFRNLLRVVLSVPSRNFRSFSGVLIFLSYCRSGGGGGGGNFEKSQK